MKKNDLFAAIRQAANAAMPDVRQKIDLESVNISAPGERPIRVTPRFSRVFVSLFLIVAVSTGLYFGFVDQGDPLLALESPEEVIGYQVLSGAAFAINYVNTTLSMPLEESPDRSLIEDNISRLISIITVFESLLGDKDDIAFVLSESDNPAYEAMIVFTSKDIDGEFVDITMYLDTMPNETTVSYSGTILFEDTSIDFAFTNGILSITNGVCRLEVINLSNELAQQFRYTLYVSGTLRWSTDVNLLYHRGVLQADVETEIDAVPFHLNISKSNQRNKMAVSYSFGNSTVLESGEIEVSNVYNTASSQYEYVCNATVRTGNTQRSVMMKGHRDTGSMPHRGGMNN